MAESASSPHRVRVADLEVDLDSGEILRNGARVRLQGQSLELLKALLDSPGTMVSREALRQRLWPDDTFVDFDHGLNAAVRRLRETLDDSADAPRFIETIPRRGYRLVAAAADIASPPAATPEPAADPPVSEPPALPPLIRRGKPWTYVIPVAMAVVLVIITAGAKRGGNPMPTSGRPPFATFDLDVPAGWSIRPTDHLALSPDNRYLAFTAAGPDHRTALWVRELAGAVARQVAQSEGAVAPFWSADSTRVGFFANGALKAMRVPNGPVQHLQDVAPALLSGGAAAWTSNGDILFMPLGSAFGSPVHAAGLRRLNPTSGAVEPLSPSSNTTNDSIDYLAPSAVPGANAFTFVRWNLATLQMTGHVYQNGSARVVDLGSTSSRVIVTESGHALFVREGELVAQRFDVANLRLTGARFTVAHDVAVSQPMLGHFTATSDVIAYLTRQTVSSGTTLSIVDRKGAVTGSSGEVADYSGIRVSPDGTRLAVARRDPLTGTRDIWLHDLTGKPPVRLTFDRHDDLGPAWSADAQAILFTSDRSGERDIYRKTANGAATEVSVFSSHDSKSLNAWSPDGRFFIYDNGARARLDSQGHVNKDLFTVSLDRTPRVWPLAATQVAEFNADISPDGTLVAYQSLEAGRPEVFVETFPQKGGRWQVTTTGASEPMWGTNGHELFFVSAHDELSAVTVDRVGAAVRFGSPRVLFRAPNLPNTARRYAPFPDGQRFVVLTATAAPAHQQMTILVNWRSVLPE